MSDDQGRSALLEEYRNRASALCDAVAQGQLERALEYLEELQSLMTELGSGSVGAPSQEERVLIAEALSLLGLGADGASEGKGRVSEEIEAVRAIRAHLRSAAAELDASSSAGAVDCQI